MPTVTNESVSGASSQSANPDSANAASRRTEAVGVEIPVVVHASRNSGAARGIAKPLPPVHEETRTVIVFPQGAVVRLTAAVTVGELVVLTHQGTGADVLCRVASVKAQTGIQNYVGLDFTQRAPGFWGDCFPAEKSAAPANGASVSAPQSGVVVPSLLTRPAPVQPISAVPAPVAQPPAAVRPPAEPIVARLPVQQVEAQAVDQFAGKTSFDVAPAAVAGASASGAGSPNTGFSYSQGSQDWTQRGAPQLRAEESPASSKKILVAAAAAVVVIAAVTGSVLLLRSRPAAPAPQLAAASAVVSQPPAIPLNSLSTSPNSVVATPATPTTPTASTESETSTHPAEPVAAKPGTQPPASAAKQASSRKPGLDKLSAPIARPLTIVSSSEPPPVLPATANVAALGNGLLVGVGGNSGPAAPASVVPASRPGGGQISQPKLISSPAPSYPPAAKTEHVQGDVIVDALVDTRGHVVATKVISGSPLLQQAATTALSDWKYEPARLDGEPVSTHVQVRISFRLP